MNGWSMILALDRLEKAHLDSNRHCLQKVTRHANQVSLQLLPPISRYFASPGGRHRRLPDLWAIHPGADAGWNVTTPART